MEQKILAARPTVNGKPTISAQEWNDTHKDFRGGSRKEGTTSILSLWDGATTLVPVHVLEPVKVWPYEVVVEWRLKDSTVHDLPEWHTYKTRKEAMRKLRQVSKLPGVWGLQIIERWDARMGVDAS